MFLYHNHIDEKIVKMFHIFLFYILSYKSMPIYKITFSFIYSLEKTHDAEHLGNGMLVI